MGKFFLGLLWLAAATYAGYYLTERSFAFLEEPNFGLESASVLPGGLQFDPQALVEKLPQTPQDAAAWYEDQPTDIKLCLRAALGSEKLDKALAGGQIQPSPSEVLAITKCLN